MIPKIIPLTSEDTADTIINQSMQEHHISPLHVMRIEPENEELTLEQIHLFQQDIQVSLSHPLLVVLRGVDSSSHEVQNALLKSLEEESERIHFLLLVQNPLLLLPTIRSRCSLIEGKKEMRSHSQKMELSEVFSFTHNSISTKDSALQKIDEYISSDSSFSPSILHHILTMRKLIADNNVNPVMALDSILIFNQKTSTIKTIHET